MIDNEFYNIIINECFRNMKLSELEYTTINDDVYTITFVVYDNYSVIIIYNSGNSIFKIKIHDFNNDNYILNINYSIDNTITKMFELIKQIIQFNYFA